MKPIQFALLTFALFAGCFAGSWFALRPTPAQAQQNVRVEEYLFVPNGGLRMQNSRGRVLGVIGEQNGSAMISLMGPDGTPSVQIFGGPGGSISLGASESASGLQVKGANGATASVIAQNGKGSVSVGANQSMVEIAGGNESHITLPGANGGLQVEIRSGADGGILRLLNAGKAMVEMTGSGGKGRVLVNGDGPAGVRLDGSGLLDILRAGQNVFTAPPVTAGSRSGAIGL